MVSKHCSFLVLIVAAIVAGCAPSQEDITDSCKGSADVPKCEEQTQLEKDLAKPALNPKP